MSTHAHARSSAAIAALALIATVAMAWLFLRRNEQAVRGLEPRASVETLSKDAESKALEPIEPASPAGDDARERVSVETLKQNAGTEGGGKPPVIPPPPATSAVTQLDVLFVRPDHREIEVESAHVNLVDGAGKAHALDVVHSSKATIEAAATGLCTLRITAPGYAHHEQRFDLQRPDRSKADASGGRPGSRGKLPNPGRDADGAVAQERTLLWPASWVAVRIETPDGRSFTTLATDLGLEPRRLFAGGAIAVAASIEGPGPRGDTPTRDPSLARFHAPPDYKTHELQGGAAGSLELLHAPPLWCVLDLYGVPLTWELLAPNQRSITFRIDGAALDERFASIALRVVDATTRAPVAGARVTLRADSSAHRRKDQDKVPTAADGRLELQRIVPGRYELEVVRGESQNQQMITLAPRERRELGDIALGDSAGFDVIVVDSDGKPVGAYVEIGPYTPGRRTIEMFPQMMRHLADGSGRARLPLPSVPSIVRAAVESGRSNSENSVQELYGIRSAIVLLDPKLVTSTPLKLVLADTRKVRLSTSRDDAARIEVLDELDVIVARASKKRAVDVDVVPGRYRARLVTADGAARDTAFTVDRDDVVLALD